MSRTSPTDAASALASTCNTAKLPIRCKAIPPTNPALAIYRNIFQAYGTYVAPVGNGLTIDFGKWGSSLGIEGNYTKDQMNYSRSFFFDFLPFYHMGVRVAYPVNDSFTLTIGS